MIKVGFNTSPLHNANQARGVGFYAKRLLPELTRQASQLGIEISENLAGCDVVHYPFFDLFFHTLPIFKQAKTVVTIHDVIPLEFPQAYPLGVKGKINLQLQKLALGSVAQVITDSQASQAAIIKYLGYPADRIHVIYLAADAKFKKITDQKELQQVKTKYQLPDKFVLYVGDVNWNKNIPSLIQACEQINYPLVIVGKQAKDIEQIDLSHAELRHLKNINWLKVKRLGFVSDEELVAIYNLATVYCQPSYAEGFGLPVLEAMACGTAVACSRTHSLPEIGGDAAITFDPYNVAEIGQAILKAKPNGVIEQAKKFSWASTARQTLEVYKQAI